MTTRTYTLTFAGAGTGTLPAGVFFYVKSATAALTIRTRGSTSAPIEFNAIGAGLKFGPVPESKRWTYLDVESAVAQSVDVIVSDDAEVDIASTVNVAGNVQVSEVPSTVLATPARVTVDAAGAVDASHLLIAANPLRRRLLVQAIAANLDNVNIGPAASIGVSQGIELQPGQSIPLTTTAAVYAYSVSGNATLQVLEET